MSLVLTCGGLSFREAPVEIREQAAFAAAALPAALDQLRMDLGLEEAVLLSTCNRVEYFGLARNQEEVPKKWPAFLRNFHRAPVDFTPFSFHLFGRACVERLFRTAAGLESMVIGETEILGQVKDAYETASQRGAAGARLHRLFQSSFAAAKAVHTQTRINRGNVSVGSVAVDLTEKLFGRLDNRTVLLIGAGEISQRTARSFRNAGIGAIEIANRTGDKAEDLAATLGGTAIPWEMLGERLDAVDIIVSSTSSPAYILTHAALSEARRRRVGRPLFLIDLAVPRNIDPAADFIDDVYLYNIDALQSIADSNHHQRAVEILHGERILAPHIDRLMAWLDRRT